MPQVKMVSTHALDRQRSSTKTDARIIDQDDRKENRERDGMTYISTNLILNCSENSTEQALQLEKACGGSKGCTAQ